MVVPAKYHEEDEPDAPPSYESITTSGGRQTDNAADAKSPRQPGPTSRPASWSQSNPSSWFSIPSFTSSRTSKQVRQTVLALIRDLVLSVDSPDLLSSCADACRSYSLDLSALLQEPSIEHHSAIYWCILNHRDTVLPSLLAYTVPLSEPTISEIRLACLASSNQPLFQSLRCQREPFTKEMTPLSTSPGTDTLVLGSMPADEVSIREADGEGTFVAEMQINLWQKRMRVGGRVNIEFIARGRIWSLIFFSPPSAAQTGAGMWQVALCLLEHSPPTFIDSRLVIDMPLSSSAASQSSDLISLSPLPDDATTQPSPSSPPPPSSQPKWKSKAPQRIEVRLKSAYRLAYDGKKDRTLPCVEHWRDDSGTFTNAIVVPLDDSSGAELLYANTPFISDDGALRVRLEARLGKPDTECIIS